MSNQFTEAEIERIKEEILDENPDIKDENCIEFDEALKERFINDEFNSYYGNPSLTAHERNR